MRPIGCPGRYSVRCLNVWKVSDTGSDTMDRVSDSVWGDNQHGAPQITKASGKVYKMFHKLSDRSVRLRPTDVSNSIRQKCPIPSDRSVRFRPTEVSDSVRQKCPIPSDRSVRFRPTGVSDSHWQDTGFSRQNIWRKATGPTRCSTGSDVELFHRHLSRCSRQFWALVKGKHF